MTVWHFSPWSSRWPCWLGQQVEAAVGGRSARSNHCTEWQRVRSGYWRPGGGKGVEEVPPEWPLVCLVEVRSSTQDDMTGAEEMMETED